MGAGIYAQFDIPKETFELHKLTFKSLAKNYVEVEEIDIFRDPNEAKTVPNYERARNFDWGNSDNIITHLWSEFEEQRITEPLIAPSLGKPIDNIDAEIIRELTINGKTKITDLADYFNLNKSTLSRRVSRIRENYVTSGALAFGKNAFKLVGFNNMQLVTGRFTKDSTVNSETFLKFISSTNILPFDAFATAYNDRFLLYTRASVGITDDILRFLFERSDPIELNQYQFYINRSVIYPFYHLNYDQEIGFKKDEEYIKEKAIAVIE